MDADSVVGEVDVETAISDMHRSMRQLCVTNFLVLVVVVLLVGATTSAFTDRELWRTLATGVAAALAAMPMAWAFHHRGSTLTAHTEQVARARDSRTAADTARRQFDADIADALDMVDTEQEALRVLKQAFVAALPGQPVELLLADHSHAHLERRASTFSVGETAGCPVGAPFDCPAARRARVHRFTDASRLNACPKLAGRLPDGATATCLPVSIRGRAVGVIHTIGTADTRPESTAAAHLNAIAHHTGTRLALIRVLTESQSQAATDALTGLMNRRSFENGWHQVRYAAPAATAVMADLDHFKTVNDTYGHDTGDRALRVFAGVLRSTLRSQDLVARYGGEEFAVFLPGTDAAEAVSSLQRVQDRLSTALTQGGLPTITASFGVVEALFGEDLPAVLQRADSALFASKRAGRDRITVHDAHGEELLYPATALFLDGAGDENRSRVISLED